jgi:hypothetical protein
MAITEFSFPADAFARVAAFRSSDEADEALACVLIKIKQSPDDILPEELVATAVNGHSACKYTAECDGFITSAVAKTDDDGAPEILVSVTPDLVKWAKHKNAETVRYDGKRLVVMSRAQQELFVQPGKAKRDFMPIDCDRFFQKREQCGEATASVGFSASSLRLLMDAFGRDCSFRMRFCEPDKDGTNKAPVFIDVYQGGTEVPLAGYQVIVMPMGYKD